jgi:uncharacterized protein (TIGR02145 family)
VKLPYGGDIIEFIKWQVGSMLGLDVGQRPTSAPQIPSAPVSNTSSTQQPINQVTAPTNQPSGVDGSGTLTDSRDGKKYRTVVIGGKRWMAENLNYRVKGNSWCYGNDNSYCDKYGRLYDWNTAKTVCPTGFHLPSREEWDDLVDAAGGKGVAGKKLTAKSGNGTDNFGFSALLGGLRLPDGSFYAADDIAGYWWTATENSGGTTYYRYVNGYSYEYVYERGYTSYGLSVRCVAD